VVTVMAFAPVLCLVLAIPVLVKGRWASRGLAIGALVVASASSFIGCVSVLTHEGPGSPYWGYVAGALAVIILALGVEAALLRRLSA